MLGLWQIYALNKLYRGREEASFAEFKSKQDAARAKAVEAEHAAPPEVASNAATPDEPSVPAVEMPTAPHPPTTASAAISTGTAPHAAPSAMGSGLVLEQKAAAARGSNAARQWDPNAAKAAALLGGALPLTGTI